MFHISACKVIDSVLSFAAGLLFSLSLTVVLRWTASAGHGSVWHHSMSCCSVCRCIASSVPQARVSFLVHSIRCAACIMCSQHESRSFSEFIVHLVLAVHGVSRHTTRDSHCAGHWQAHGA